MGEGRLTGDDPPSSRRLTVPQAAARLGITEAAVRGRIKRGTLRSYREAGAVYVLLESDEPSPNLDEPTDQPTDQSELLAVLREQLAAEREANRENRRIIAGLIERIPELEAPRETPHARETAAGEPEGPESRPAPGGTQEATRRPWWRRIFGV